MGAPSGGLGEIRNCAYIAPFFCVPVLQQGRGFRTVRELPGRLEAQAAMIHSHVLKRATLGVASRSDS